MKNSLKGLGVGIALTFVWTYLYVAYDSLPRIGMLSDLVKEPPPVTIYTVWTHVFYWIVVGLLFVLSFWFTRTRPRPKF